VSVKKSFLLLILLPLVSWAQVPEGIGELRDLTHLHPLVTYNWVVYGRTTDVRGNPLGDVTVTVDAGIGAGAARVLKTNLQGEFHTEYVLDATTYRRLTIKVVATKPGYADARETAEYGGVDKTSGIALVLRQSTPNPNLVSMEMLTETLAPRLQQDAAKVSGVGGARRVKEFDRGCEELLDRDDAVRAVPLLSKASERAPGCMECRLLLILALFDSGSWASASQQLDEAVKLNDAATSKRPEPDLIAGVFETWRGETGGAESFFEKALEIDPENVLALQEMGRILVGRRNWEAALQYLDTALRAGAGREVLLLRVRALLGKGDVAEAQTEMGKYTAGHKLNNLSYEARALNVQVHDRLRLEHYANAISVLTESPQGLLKAMPELEGIRWASNQDDLKAVLEKTGEGVKSFFDNLPNTVSLERVHEERLGKDGKVERSMDQEFQYLFLVQPEPSGVGTEEHRATAQGARASLNGSNEGLMLTEGFASVPLLFHPLYQDGAGFRYLGLQTVEGKDLHVVAFAQKPQTARTHERFQTRDGSALILVQGVAWIDPASFQIVRLRTDLLAPQPKIRLRRQTTEISFRKVSFKEVATSVWLPQEVGVTVDLRGRVFHNVHRYSDFRLFNVETKEERKAVPIPSPTGQQE
jgi:tetratricopeptide (TPR) repeat protein